MILDEVKKNLEKRELLLNEYACKNGDAIRIVDEEVDLRSPFYRDIDRIIYSLSYTRYIDKTQVFSLNVNDNISRRMTHVQMVSKIARTIGRALGLNEDLIEAAALGHDLGHVPFGHAGEAILNDISLDVGEGFFNHNIQSVRTLMVLENKGRGFNITLQVLDAIMCHNGELPLQQFEPVEKTWDTFLATMDETYTNRDLIKYLRPMTLEGCVVRISDIIGYIGRDIEDALRLGVIKSSDLPKEVISVLGVSNREIINTIILDVIAQSINKPYLKMSDKVFAAVINLKKFNTEHIYAKANTEEDLDLYRRMFNYVYYGALRDLEIENKSANIYKVFLDGMSDDYLNNTSNTRIVLDYVAGMTDDYLIRQYNER